jgi:hypothetical protein
MRRVLEGLRSLLIWTVALPAFAAVCLLILLVALVDRGPRLERLIKACCRFVLFLCGVRVRVAGRENVVPGRAYILMMNSSCAPHSRVRPGGSRRKAISAGRSTGRCCGKSA